MDNRSRRKLRADARPMLDEYAHGVRRQVAKVVGVEPKHVSVDITARIPMEYTDNKEQFILQLSTSVRLGAPDDGGQR